MNQDNLKGIDLTDSFVLSWRTEDDSLIFNVEFSLWPESEFYTPPKPNQYTCYRKSSLIFTNVSQLNGLKSMKETQSTTDPDGTIDYGNIDEFTSNSDNNVWMSGDFGEVKLRCDNWDIQITSEPVN